MFWFNKNIRKYISHDNQVVVLSVQNIKFLQRVQRQYQQSEREQQQPQQQQLRLVSVGLSLAF